MLEVGRFTLLPSHSPPLNWSLLQVNKVCMIHHSCSLSKSLFDLVMVPYEMAEAAIDCVWVCMWTCLAILLGTRHHLRKKKGYWSAQVQVLFIKNFRGFTVRVIISVRS